MGETGPDLFFGVTITPFDTKYNYKVNPKSILRVYPSERTGSPFAGQPSIGRRPASGKKPCFRTVGHPSDFSQAAWTGLKRLKSFPEFRGMGVRTADMPLHDTPCRKAGSLPAPSNREASFNQPPGDPRHHRMRTDADISQHTESHHAIPATFHSCQLGQYPSPVLLLKPPTRHCPSSPP